MHGQVFTWWAISSTTKDLKKIENNPMFLGNQNGTPTLFSIDAMGVDIAPFSAYPKEREVILLPGTTLVVEPGVMVEDKYWRFEASVCQAMQQQRHTHDQQHQQQLREQHDGEKNEGIQAAAIAAAPRFQDTDLPHPDWEAIVST